MTLKHPAGGDARSGPATAVRLTVLALAVGCLGTLASLRTEAQEVGPRTLPNVLWLSSEDNGPHLGAYGDDFADTPNLDALAARGLRYNVVWSSAPVCAPARTTIITGVEATSLGAEHMRSSVPLPPDFELFPYYLRRAGYYTSNNAKEDYNLEGWGIAGEGTAERGRVWDDSSRAAHWRNRPPGAPFFAVFNYEATHESQIRRRPHAQVHDPAGVRLPAYHPDTPEVRLDWAQYYDQMTRMDAQVGERLRELEADGLADSTIVFYWGDHGIGLPRSKRTPLDSGLLVPLIVYVPPAFRDLAPPEYGAGAATDRPVAFVDFAATMLSLAGLEPPAYYEGRAFLGAHTAPPRELVFGYRGRMDERIDLVRSARDRRWVYVRNYMPQRSWGQFISYLFQTPTTQVWYRLWREGKLTPEQSLFWQPTRAYEELYDLRSDPDEVHSLAASREHAGVIGRFRVALDRHLAETRDTGFMPEAEMLARSRRDSPWQAAHDPARYPFEAVRTAARMAARGASEDTGRLRELLSDPEALLRYWGVQGLIVRGADAVVGARAQLEPLLEDPSPSVRIVAAEALGRWGDEGVASRAIDVLLECSTLERHELPVVVAALNSLDAVGSRAAGAADRIRALATTGSSVSRKQAGYVPQLIARILDELEGDTA